MSEETTVAPKTKGKKKPDEIEATPKKGGKKAPLNGEVKEKKEKVEKEDTMDPALRREKEQAKKIDLPLGHFRVLKALADKKFHTYRQIEELTKSDLVPEGYYKPLTKWLRENYDGSLGELGYVTEALDTSGTREVIQFKITQAGIEALKKAK